MENFIVKKDSERLPKIFRIHNTIEEEFVKIGECNDLLFGTEQDAQEVCDILNKVDAFC